MGIAERRQSPAAERQIVVLRQNPLRLVGRDHGDREVPCERRHRFRRIVLQHLDPGDQDRAFRVAQQIAGEIQIGTRRGRGWGRADTPRRRLLRLFSAGERGRNIDMDRAGPSVHGNRHRLVDDRVDGAVDQGKARLGNAADQCRVVEDLVVVGLRFRRIDAAGQVDQRDAVLFGVDDEVDRVGHARTDRRQQHAGRAGDVKGAFGHEAAGILMLDQNEFEARLLERLHHRQHLAAGNAEGVAAAGLVQTARDELCRCRHYVRAPARGRFM